MATLQDLDRAYILARAAEDGSEQRLSRRYHARDRAAFTLRDRIKADTIAERRATDGKDR